MRALMFVLAGALPATAQDFGPVHDVLSHPRCANCHVGEDGIPLQSNADGSVRAHAYGIRGGESRVGIETLPCLACHTDRNGTLPGSAPGAAGWALPPPEMQWAARSAAEICAQIKDPERNGGRTLAEIADHVSHDPLVVWGWTPGPGRDPVPGTPDEAAAAILAWAAAGAPCP